MLNINKIRNQFPVLDQQVYGKPLVYLDNAATTQKPLCVIERERDYYLHENCNIHRGVHYLSQKATEAYEHARQTIADFVHAKEAREIIFTRGTTESLNLLATSFEHLLLSTPNSQLSTDSQLSTLLGSRWCSGIMVSCLSCQWMTKVFWTLTAMRTC